MSNFSIEQLRHRKLGQTVNQRGNATTQALHTLPLDCAVVQQKTKPIHPSELTSVITHVTGSKETADLSKFNYFDQWSLLTTFLFLMQLFMQLQLKTNSCFLEFISFF